MQTTEAEFLGASYNLMLTHLSAAASRKLDISRNAFWSQSPQGGAHPSRAQEGTSQVRSGHLTPRGHLKFRETFDLSINTSGSVL